MGVGQLRQKKVVLNGGIPGSKVVANLYIPERTTATTGVGYDSEQKDDGILRKKINLLFGHANGFHKEHWLPVIKRIFGYDADFLKKGIEINQFIAIDFFHHGDSAGLNKDILVKCDKPGK
ncbi:hypothetical protein AX774_g3152 [Zancudomyces culisetae]|uniref:Uncharacterized protein n=1 Tax=Zancudomyces culisetae TaxID=1213189 RepID=A0A1R1PR13_ZANCU|nr:hypothetical protein AX774_g5443 [Zancudomyces culisetae]OMH83343.1 hypothetical protein AX774_g3152 [Zancudomyces culisetae]|eukprot:OMH81114.1 hypothetical protein AX774_g5443 [Zancudomyces culisetae]